MIYLISDTHFGHKNIAKFCGRPDNHEDLIWQGMSKLKSDDVLIHLGDFAFRCNAAYKKELWEKFCSVTPCKKYLVEGNHDERSKARKLPWHSVIRLSNQPWVIYRNGIEIRMRHHPLDIHGFDGILIHGHLHNLGSKFEWLNSILKVNVSVEQVNYEPIALDEIIVEYYKGVEINDREAEVR